MSDIPCISLWQPWASLMSIGAKCIETRSWPTKHRGTMAIHAASRWGADIRRVASSPEFTAALAPAGFVPLWDGEPYLPLGKIVAVVDLVDVIRIDRGFMPGVYGAPGEIRFGDYSDGRYAWITERPRRLADPVPYPGKQRLFRIPLSKIVDYSGGTP